jgi:glucoamylase
VTTASPQAPGHPGATPNWAAAAKTGVGTALSTASSVWFTLNHGRLTEVYFPFVDTACIRDLEFLVGDRHDFFSEEKKDTDSQVNYLAPGVPAFKLLNTCRQGRYRIEKEILADPRRSSILQQVHFVPLQGQLADYCLCVLLNPHLKNQGSDNTAWIGDYKGTPMLFACHDGTALALACSKPWRKLSAGFVGNSDGWQDLSRHKQMTWSYERAERGNVALTGEVDLEATEGRFVLALGFGRNEGEAGHYARASLLQGFEAARKKVVQQWSDWHKTLLPMPGSKQHHQDLYRISAAVMRTHESKHFPGGVIASLAVPWGASHGDGDLGYHLAWPRDMIETVGGLLALKGHEDARRVLFYFEVTQEADGHWPQNMFLHGLPFWNGVQLDETAFVILLVNLAHREGALHDKDLPPLWPMVRAAASYLVRNGPVTPLDRWEEEAGYFASTMAVEIPALLIAAELAETCGEPKIAAYLRETADAWNAAIERLIYVTGTDLARDAGVEGYYVRFALPNQLEMPSPAYGSVSLKNHADQSPMLIAHIISPDALTLVRFGLRAADDPRIVNTVRVIDKHLKVDTPSGPCWHRYSNDGYGEHADGSPFDGTGIGRAWPLLTGERAHYELAAGRKDVAEKLVRTLEGFANDSGLISEQIWDSPDIPEHELTFGRPSGSAMPLVWAHAEYVKLRRSLNDGRIFDMPPQTVERYLKKKTGSPHIFWRFNQKCCTLAAGKVLRLEVLAAAVVHWSSDNWRTRQDIKTKDTGLGIHYVDLPTDKLPAESNVVFTFYWPDGDRWEGQDFQVAVEKSTRRDSGAPTQQAHEKQRSGVAGAVR